MLVSRAGRGVIYKRRIEMDDSIAYELLVMRERQLWKDYRECPNATVGLPIAREAQKVEKMRKELASKISEREKEN